MNQSFDYIISGGGLAGLSLAYRLCDKRFSEKKVLIIDKERKNKNDRTWCFWEKEVGTFEDIVSKKWSELNFYSTHGHIDLDIEPYVYKMIKGIDFYKHCLAKIESNPNIQMVHESVSSYETSDSSRLVHTDTNTYQARYIFNSALRPEFDKSKYNYVDQHFKGWIIQTTHPCFDPNRATIMDFRIPQEDEARFLYVLPTEANKALVEVAIFSNEILDQGDYNKILSDYIDEYLDAGKYTIEEEEFGIIPMTDFPFPDQLAPGIINIGTPGGAVKASSGYAFKRIQEQCDSIIEKLDQGKTPIPEKRKRKYMWLDKVLLNVVQTNKCSSAEVFHRLFKKHKASFVFKFLDEQSTFWDDLGIVSAPPKLPFLKAAMEELFH